MVGLAGNVAELSATARPRVFCCFFAKKQTSLIWLNGALHHPAHARIDPADRGLLLGDGVYETLRAAAHRAWHAPRHLARLRGGAAMLGIAVPWNEAAILAGIDAVLGAAADGDHALRLTLTRGPAPRGLLPAPGGQATLLIAASALPPAAPPAHVIVAACTRRNEHSPLSRIKSTNTLDSILARQEAAARGADDAILLNTAGHVAETSAGTLFALIEGRLVTPPVEDGALPGIARALILQAGLAVERRLTQSDLKAADAAFITSSLGVRPIQSIDGRILPGVGTDHAALLKALQAALEP